MLRIAIGTMNPLKIEGVKEAFSKFFLNENIDVFPYDVESKVPFQPLNEKDIIRGCYNRIKGIKKSLKEEFVDYYVGVEGGIIISNQSTYNLQIVQITNCDGLTAIGRSSAFEIPEELISVIAETGLKSVLDKEFGGKGISFLSNSIFNRTKMVEDATVMALSSLKWKILKEINKFNG